MKYEELGKGIIKKRERRILGIFIDGTGLDRATRRLNRRVDLSALVKGVCSGMPPAVARYYTLIPYEDDSRQRAFLDAVARAGLTVIVKRLPPKGITRQVAVDVEMAADMIAFARGHTSFSANSQYLPEGAPSPDAGLTGGINSGEVTPPPDRAPDKEVRAITVVCPSRDLTYPIQLAKDLAVDTTTADFGKFNTGDILKSAAKWIDLSDSETIWKD